MPFTTFDYIFISRYGLAILSLRCNLMNTASVMIRNVSVTQDRVSQGHGLDVNFHDTREAIPIKIDPKTTWNVVTVNVASLEGKVCRFSTPVKAPLTSKMLTRVAAIKADQSGPYIMINS